MTVGDEHGRAELERADSREDTGPGRSMKVCPTCAESVQQAAVRCRFCGHKFKALAERPARRSRARVAGMVAVVLLLCAATGAVAYLAADPSGARAAGHKAGERDGKRTASAEAAANQESVSKIQDEIHQTDLDNLRAQLRSARAAANRRYVQGGRDAFGQFNTAYQNGSYYVVHVVAGTGGLEHAVSSRTESMEFGWSYYLCPGGDDGSVCKSPDAPTG